MAINELASKNIIKRLDAIISLMVMQNESIFSQKGLIPERLLTDYGFTQSEIALLLRKTQSAVSQNLSREAKK